MERISRVDNSSCALVFALQMRDNLSRCNQSNDWSADRAIDELLMTD